jgi:hypothetical protein
MYGYPWLHPFRSQSQVDFASQSIRSIDYRARKGGIVAPTSSDDFQLFGNISAVEALMEPGDVLYIPPLWYHRVVTEDASIAINSWTDPPEGDPFGRLTKLPIPAEAEWNHDQLSVALLRFFREISSRFPPLLFPGAPENTEWAFAYVVLIPRARITALKWLYLVQFVEAAIFCPMEKQYDSVWRRNVEENCLLPPR